MSATPRDITKESPYDSAATTSSPLVQIKAAHKKTHWLPSMYNTKTTADDGSLIVWNTYSGTISVFKPEQKPLVEQLLKDGFSGEPKGAARYLSDRGLLVAHDINEFRQFQLDFGKQHYRQDTLELILLASEDCNFRCKYCYEEFPRGTMQPSVRENIKKLVRKRAGELRRFGVGWFGGEPLYGFKAIEDLAPFFVEVADEYSLDYASHMTTNGYLLTPDIADKLLAWKVRHFQITIDGLAAQHNHNRPTRDGQGTFETIIANLQALKQRDDSFGVNIRVNFDKENYPHLEGLLELVQQEFSQDPRFYMTLHGVGKWGGPNDDELEVCGVGEGKQVKLQLQKSAVEKGINLKGTIRDLTQSEGKGVCYAARPYNFIVGADGKIMKCTVALDKQDHNIVGKLNDEGDILLNAENYALWVEPAFEGDQTCRKCSMLPTCQGISCPLVRIEKNARPCAATPKVNLHNELLATLEIYKAKATSVTVSSQE